MNKNHNIIAGLLTAAALAASSSFVYAQADKSPAQGAGPGANRGEMHHGPRDGGDHRHGHHGKWSNPKAAIEGHLAALKVELKITPAQENAWQAFATKARLQADAMTARHEQRKAQPQATSLSAPDQLAKRTERMKQHVAGMEARTAAVKELYGALTPEQKTIADKQFARGGHRGGFRGHHGGGEGHQHG